MQSTKQGKQAMASKQGKQARQANPARDQASKPAIHRKAKQASKMITIPALEFKMLVIFKKYNKWIQREGGNVAGIRKHSGPSTMPQDSINTHTTLPNPTPNPK